MSNHGIFAYVRVTSEASSFPNLPLNKMMAIKSGKESITYFPFKFFNKYLLNSYYIQVLAPKKKKKYKPTTLFGAMVVMLTCVLVCGPHTPQGSLCTGLCKWIWNPLLEAPVLSTYHQNNLFCELCFILKYFYRESRLRLHFYKNNSSFLQLLLHILPNITKNSIVQYHHDILQKG